MKVKIYVNKTRLFQLCGRVYKKKNAKIVREGCIWYLTRNDLLGCTGWDSQSLKIINSLKNTRHCFGFLSNKDFTGWLIGNFPYLNN